jgi:hypothetical protein
MLRRKIKQKNLFSIDAPEVGHWRIRLDEVKSASGKRFVGAQSVNHFLGLARILRARCSVGFLQRFSGKNGAHAIVYCVARGLKRRSFIAIGST